MPAPELSDAELAFLHETFELARSGRTDELATRVDAGVPVDLTNAAGDTLLLLAAYHAHPDTVQALLDRSADTGRVNDRGQTALGAAVFRQSTDTVVRLLAAGASPDVGRQSARAVAAFFDLPEMAALLDDGPPSPQG